ncbi:MAG: PIN domain-containing protein [Thermoguttaceae bacterium]|nr:PIN domain-containing protein [Thermoguttaceae bacterium]
MNFSSIASGTSLFVDANVFVYSYAGDQVLGDPCTDLLERIELKDLQGFISASLFSEVAYRLMTLEACQTLGWSYAGIARQLRRHPAEIQKLQKFRKALDDIAAIGIRILPVSAPDVLMAGDLSIQHGLLSGDALILAMMHNNGLMHLASNDADFDRVPGITRYAPA